MHTQNVKTAAQESSRKMGENPINALKKSAQALIEAHTRLRDGVTVSIADVSRHGDVQVEIRRYGQLDWRAWSFEPDFLTSLERHLQAVQQK